MSRARSSPSAAAWPRTAPLDATAANRPAPAPLLDGVAAEAPFLYTAGGVLSAGEFLRRVAVLSAALPAGPHAVNLCERRELFLVAWCAVAARGQTNLLPASRAPAAVADARAGRAGSYLIDDQTVLRALAGPAPALTACPAIDEAQLVQIAFTSGSTGAPRGFGKRWGSLRGSSACSAARIRACLGPLADARPTLVATVPPQHTYGAETTVLLPLLERMAVHGGRPLFPADVAAALAQVPEPRVLVTTPVHLRALVTAGVTLPPIGLVLSATAPLDAGLAAAAERLCHAPLMEIFGSTETCAMASRRTASEPVWQLYPGVRVQPCADHALVDAPWFEETTQLQDIIELQADGRMRLLGRNADMVEIAGKRASLADLTRRVLAVPGVRDAIVLQPDTLAAQSAGGVRRVAALVVAPGVRAAAISAALSELIDPVFLPRPLLLVPALPRNALGKLERAELLSLVHAAD